MSYWDDLIKFKPKKKKKCFYLCGSMTGYPEYNYPRFFEVEAIVRKLGFNVVNTARIYKRHDNKKSWQYYLKNDTILLMTKKIDGLVLIEGWEKGKGTLIEVFLAKTVLGVPLYTLTKENTLIPYTPTQLVWTYLSHGVFSMTEWK